MKHLCLVTLIVTLRGFVRLTVSLITVNYIDLPTEFMQYWPTQREDSFRWHQACSVKLRKEQHPRTPLPEAGLVPPPPLPSLLEDSQRSFPLRQLHIGLHRRGSGGWVGSHRVQLFEGVRHCGGTVGLGDQEASGAARGDVATCSDLHGS